MARRPGQAQQEPHTFWAWWAQMTVTKRPCGRWEVGVSGVSSLGTPAQEVSGTELSVTAWLWGWVCGEGLSCPWVGEELSPGLKTQSPVKVA